MQKRKLIGTLIISTIILGFLYAPRLVLADDSTGRVTVYDLPQPSSIEIYDEYSTYTAADGLTPNDEMALNFTITDLDMLANLTTVVITIYDQAKAVYNDAANQTELCKYNWTESTDTWAIDEESGSSWALNSSQCADPGTDNSATSYEFRLVFTPGTNAFEETTNQWIFNVSATDDQSLAAYNTTVVSAGWAGTCDFYHSMSFTQGTVNYTFAGASAGGNNVTITLVDGAANTYLIFNITSNGVWDINGTVTDWSGPEAIDVDATPIEWINDDGSWDDGFTQPINTTVSIFWDGSALSHNNTLEDGETKNVYLRLAVPAGKSGGTYNQTLTMLSLDG